MNWGYNLPAIGRVRLMSYGQTSGFRGVRMTVDRRHFLKQAGSYLGSAAGISPTPSARAAWGTPAASITQAGGGMAPGEDWLDLSEAKLFASSDPSPRVQRALLVLSQEVEKRTELRLPVVHSRPSIQTPTVVVERFNGSLGSLHGQLGRAYPVKPESYEIHVAHGEGAPVVYVEGFDERGVLYGVGKLLRSLRMTKLRVEVPGHFEIGSSPKYPLRGHQLGYRPKTNSYDGWDLHSSLVGFGSRAVWPQAWCQNAQTLHDATLLMRYDRLDGKARYKVRVVYAGDSFR